MTEERKAEISKAVMNVMAACGVPAADDMDGFDIEEVDDEAAETN